MAKSTNANTNAPTEADVRKLAEAVIAAYANVQGALNDDTIARFNVGRVVATRAANITLERLMETLTAMNYAENIGLSQGALSRAATVYSLYVGKVVLVAGGDALTITQMAVKLTDAGRGHRNLYTFRKLAKDDPTAAFLAAIEHGKPEAVHTDLVSLRVREATREAAYNLVGRTADTTDDDVLAFLVTRVNELTADLLAAREREDAITARAAGSGKRNRNGAADKPGSSVKA